VKLYLSLEKNREWPIHQIPHPRYANLVLCLALQRSHQVFTALDKITFLILFFHTADVLGCT
jgi:hypothetical protein